MAGLILAFKVVFPIFVFMALGYFLRYKGKLDGPSTVKINQMVFVSCLPLVIFLSVYNSDFSQDFSLSLVLTAVGLSLLLFIIGMLIVPRVISENPKRGAVFQGVFRSNMVLLGIPIAQAVYGDNATKVMGVVIAFVVPILNGFSVFALEYFSGKGCSPIRIVKSMLHNPVIIAAISGFALQLLHLQLPDLVLGVLEDLAAVATPLALIALGSSLRLDQMKSNWRLLSACVSAKLILSPLICVTIAVLLGFREELLLPLYCMSGSPTAVSSISMAQNMGADDEIAGQIVALTAVGSIVTIFLWVTVLKNLHFL